MSTNALVVRGVGTLAAVNFRTGWRVAAAWIVGMVAFMAATAASLVALYDSPQSLLDYANNVGAATRMLNGEIAGLSTLGGVIANEMSIVIAFGIPLMVISLTTRCTRKDEEAGRLELLLAARIGRDAPLVAAVAQTGVAIVLSAVGCAATMIIAGADLSGSWWYGASVVGIGWVFTGIVAVVVQLFEHNRTVWATTMAITVVAFLLRGVGASRQNELVWFSPLGWGDEVHAFGPDPRVGPLVVSVAATVVLLIGAFVLERHRDVGGAIFRAGAAPARASGWRSTRLGLAWYEHRTAIIGWSVGVVVMMGTYGLMTPTVIEAIEDNPAIGVVFGTDADAALDTMLSLVESSFLLLTAVIVAAFAVMAGGTLKSGEDAGRVEIQLASPIGRTRWLATQMLVIAAGVLGIGAVGAFALAATVANSTSDGSWFGEILIGAIAFVPVLVWFVGLTIAMFGLFPNHQVWSWSVFAVAAVVAYLGAALNLPQWMIDVSLFGSFGNNVIGDGPNMIAEVVVSALALVLLAAGFVGFRRRNIPHT